MGYGKAFEQEFENAQLSPEVDQDAIARQLIGEVESERRWDELLARSPERLRGLANEA